MLFTSIPHSDMASQKLDNSDSPESLPSLPTAILVTPSWKHFFAIPLAISFITDSFSSFGY